jgi:hypothetical protein
MEFFIGLGILWALIWVVMFWVYRTRYHSTCIDRRIDPPVWEPGIQFDTPPTRLTSDELEDLIVIARNEQTAMKSAQRRALAKLHPRDEQMD